MPLQRGRSRWPRQDFLPKPRTTSAVTTETAVARRMGETDTRAIRLTIPAKAEYITLGRLALTGLSVPAGEHRVALVYRPLSFRVGAAVSLASLLVLSGLAVAGIG